MKRLHGAALPFHAALFVLACAACSPSAQEESPPPSGDSSPDMSRSVEERQTIRPAIEEIDRRWRERLEVPQDSRIIGGVPVEPGEHLWAVAILYERSPNLWRQYCGGTLIAPQWVVTAAHCQVQQGDRLIIGTADISRPSGQGAYRAGHFYTAASVYNHGDYKVASKHDSDIALIRIDGATAVTPAPLLQRDEATTDGEGATVIGWGHTIEGGNASDILRKVDIKFVDHPVCESNYRERNVTVTANMLCAGEDGKDSCQGDSGGGLFVYDSDDDGETFGYRLAGVVSFGYGCARPRYPGVYTKVTNFHEWINRTMSGS